jgi:hypothetical protein
MPRKNRGPAIVLVLSLLIGLVGQAALALPLGSRPAIAESGAAGSYLAAIWGWLAERWSTLGQILATPAQQPNRVWAKTGSNADPNGQPHATCVQPPIQP